MMATAGPVGTSGFLPQAPPKPWWTGHLDDCHKKLQNSAQKCIRTNNEKNKSTYLDNQKKYIQAIQNHQIAYTTNLMGMVQYCPSGQFWSLRQQQLTSFALPMSPCLPLGRRPPPPATPLGPSVTSSSNGNL
eukprot:sb/3474968/